MSRELLLFVGAAAAVAGMWGGVVWSRLRWNYASDVVIAAGMLVAAVGWLTGGHYLFSAGRWAMTPPTTPAGVLGHAFALAGVMATFAFAYAVPVAFIAEQMWYETRIHLLPGRGPITPGELREVAVAAFGDFAFDSVDSWCRLEFVNQMQARKITARQLRASLSRWMSRLKTNYPNTTCVDQMRFYLAYEELI